MKTLNQMTTTVTTLIAMLLQGQGKVLIAVLIAVALIALHQADALAIHRGG